MARIEVFADIVCPFTHVGLRRLVETRNARGSKAAIVVRAWPLEWVNGHPLDPALVAREIAALRERVAPELFTGFDPATFPRTSMPAFGLVAAAYAVDDGVGEAVSLAVRDALFEHGLDVSDPTVIARIAATFDVVPLSPAAAEGSVRTNWERGKARGVRGSPHFFVGDLDWFCPTLSVRHEGDAFDVRYAEEFMREFYEVAFA